MLLNWIRRSLTKATKSDNLRIEKRQRFVFGVISFLLGECKIITLHNVRNRVQISHVTCGDYNVKYYFRMKLMPQLKFC